AEVILEAQGVRLDEMRVSWNDVSAVNLYTVHDIHPLLATTILQALGEAGRYGVNWVYARPPVTGLDLEIDGHAVRREIVLH
ncbi:MAG: 2-amino-5-chloromuconate deaminase CnbZ, partial [Pseudomonadota bacterium]